MNKDILLLLVVCLVSVHAFVKRDAPAAGNTQATDFVADVTNKIKDGLKELSDKLNPEAITKYVGDTVETVSKVFAELQPKEAPKA